VEEFRLSGDPQDLGALHGTTLGDLQLGRRTGALVLAVKTPQSTTPVRQYRGSQYRSGEDGLVANPGRDLQLLPGQMLVVMGSKAQLARVEELLGPALRSVDAVAG
jgi:voltage-gated potassium channel